MQNAVFRPKQEICALKKLVRTAALTVLTNFFFDLIFQNPILQQALFILHSLRLFFPVLIPAAEKLQALLAAHMLHAHFQDAYTVQELFYFFRRVQARGILSA